MLLALVGPPVPASRAGQETGRPRRAGAPAGASAAPVRPAQQTPSAPPRQTPTPTPTPAPAATQTPQTTGAPPKLRTQPTAEPDAQQQDENQEVDPDEVVTIDTSLVNLHVRVVDRN
ncbi:MAG TPA: hypothetical protein VF654_03205, partial [Pyrinomonadaceae bacterium]